MAHQVSQGRFIEHLGGRVPDLLHDRPDHAGAFIQTILAGSVGGLAHTGNGRQRSVDQADDPAERDGLRRSVHGVPATLAGPAVQQACALEFEQDRLQKLNQEMDNSYSILFQWTEQYRSLIEQVPSASYVLPIDGNMDFSYISPRLQTILAIPLKIWNTGYINGWKQYIHPNDRDRFQAAVSEAIADGGSFNCEYRMIQ